MTTIKNFLCLTLLLILCLGIEDNPEVGYRVGKVQGYKKLK